MRLQVDDERVVTLCGGASGKVRLRNKEGILEINCDTFLAYLLTACVLIRPFIFTSSFPSRSYQRAT
jgi:hypothetical protein